MLKTLAFLGFAAIAGRQLLKSGQSQSPPDQGQDMQSKAPSLNRRGRNSTADAVGEPGHRAFDLGISPVHPDGSARADEHFRPDIHGTVYPEDKEGLRSVTMKSARGPAGT